MSLINCEINLFLTPLQNCVISEGNRITTFYVLVVTLSTQNNTKLLKQLKSGFKGTVNWNKSKVTTQGRDQYLDYLIDPSFHGENRLCVLSYEDHAHQKRHTAHFLPTVEIKEYNFMIDGQNIFDQPVKNNHKQYIINNI